MNIKNYIFGIALLIAWSVISCSQKKAHESKTTFTKTDSLMESYLNLQDTMLRAWNMMINDDNQKIKAMHNLLHELQIGGNFGAEQLNSLEYRLQQLKRIRYTHKTMENEDVVEEYDFASNSLVSELISLAEAHPAFSYNQILQNLVEEIRAADQRVALYRAEYDSAAWTYNQFLERYNEHLSDVEDHGKLEKKPLFKMASE
jgi:hypothetical protein